MNFEARLWCWFRLKWREYHLCPEAVLRRVLPGLIQLVGGGSTWLKLLFDQCSTCELQDLPSSGRSLLRPIPGSVQSSGAATQLIKPFYSITCISKELTSYFWKGHTCSQGCLCPGWKTQPFLSRCCLETAGQFASFNHKSQPCAKAAIQATLGFVSRLSPTSSQYLPRAWPPFHSL